MNQPNALPINRLSALARTLLVALCVALPATPSLARQSGWTGTWGTAPTAAAQDQIHTFNDQSLRLIVRTSSSGNQVRVRLSNEFGSAPLHIGAAHVALRAAGANTQAQSDRALTFGGQASVTIAPGAPVISDPVDFKVPAMQDLAVTLYFPGPVKATTVHNNAFQTNYVSSAGNFAAQAHFPVARTMTSWPLLTAVDVRPASPQPTLVVFGDSITDGSSTTVDANRRWPDLLAQRLVGSARQRANTVPAVVNRGIGGNRVLRDPGYSPFGVAALARFDRDVLSTTGVAYVIVLIGINDIGQPGTNSAPLSEATAAPELIGAYRQMIARARAKGLRIFGATLLPFEGTVFPGYYTVEKEAARQTINRWIRTSGEFDGVIDFDQAMRDPANPTRLQSAYDSGDHLHPSDAGMQAMANAVPLSLFATKPAARTRVRR